MSGREQRLAVTKLGGVYGVGEWKFGCAASAENRSIGEGMAVVFRRRSSHREAPTTARNHHHGAEGEKQRSPIGMPHLAVFGGGSSATKSPLCLSRSHQRRI